MKIGIVTACCLLSGVLAAQTTQPTQSTKEQPPAGFAQSNIDPAKEKDIRRLMDITGSSSLAMQMMSEMEKNIKPLMTNALPPGDYREKLVDLFFAKFQQKADPEKLIALAVPIYDRYFSREEIRGLIEFYDTPLGHKAVSVLPKLMADLQTEGRNWGGQLGRESMAEVLNEHPELAKALGEAKKGSPPQ